MKTGEAGRVSSSHRSFGDLVVKVGSYQIQNLFNYTGEFRINSYPFATSQTILKIIGIGLVFKVWGYDLEML
jgi:hypothetical protein